MMGIKKTMAKHFAWNAMLKRLHPAAVDVPLQLSTIIFLLSVGIRNNIWKHINISVYLIQLVVSN